MIGITTSKIQEGDNIGFVIPIAAAIEEFELFLQQKKNNILPNAAHPRTHNFTLHVHDEDTLRLTGQYDAIKQAIPNYFDLFENALVVTDVRDNSPLQKDDIFLALNGEPIGGIPYNYLRQVQRSGKTVKLTLLRGNRTLEVNLDLRGIGYNGRRADLDFVLIEGMLLREFPAGITGVVYPGITTRVTIHSLLNTASTTFNEDAYPPVGSLLQAVNFGGRDYEIRSMVDLKRALNENRDKNFIRLRVYRANRIKVNKEEQTLQSPRTHAPLVDGQLETFILPLRDVVTPFQFSMHRFLTKFDFSNTGSETWEWRKALRHDRIPNGCAGAVAARKD